MINWEKMTKEDWHEWFKKYPWDKAVDDEDMLSWLEYGVPQGWHEYIRDHVYNPIHQLLAPDKLKAFYILQLKEKFGGLRLYWTINSEDYPISPEEYDKIDEIIDNAEKETELLCFRCGRKAEYLTKGWILPICKEHAIEDLEGKEEDFEKRYRKLLN